MSVDLVSFLFYFSYFVGIIGNVCGYGYICPDSCVYDPCDCDASDEININCRSDNVCHPNGCDQCADGYFKKDYNYPCVSCQETFGEECMHCSDFLGCQQCIEGYERVYDSVSESQGGCGLWYCVGPPTNSPTNMPTESDCNGENFISNGSPRGSGSNNNNDPLNENSNSDHDECYVIRQSCNNFELGGGCLLFLSPREVANTTLNVTMNDTGGNGASSPLIGVNIFTMVFHDKIKDVQCTVSHEDISVMIYDSFNDNKDNECNENHERAWYNDNAINNYDNQTVACENSDVETLKGYGCSNNCIIDPDESTEYNSNNITKYADDGDFARCGEFIPEENLSKFLQSASPLGEWSIYCQDNVNSGKGTLIEWAVELCF